MDPSRSGSLDVPGIIPNSFPRPLLLAEDTKVGIRRKKGKRGNEKEERRKEKEEERRRKKKEERRKKKE